MRLNVPREQLLSDLNTEQDKNINQIRRPDFMNQYGKFSKKVENVVKQYWPIIQSDKEYGKFFLVPPMFRYKRGVIIGDSINHPTKGYKIALKCFATCDTKQVIYSLKCSCGLVYTSQTMRPVQARIKEHKGDIRNYTEKTNTDTVVSCHFHEARHNQAQLRWQVLEVVKLPSRVRDLQKLLLQREAVWIKKLNSLQQTTEMSPLTL
ncbi:hypothetical protein XELAEV_18027642mg [Xenopus laevis]|uniref:GIY-YIG domain-containing protein n=1 Tax=Xenopus laevis TaxID=8355 RepID=A0A974CY39_XENLA|nr:hypothetical protein XELAEV_18027642mg [Xenopus laevis]